MYIHGNNTNIHNSSQTILFNDNLPLYIQALARTLIFFIQGIPLIFEEVIILK